MVIPHHRYRAALTIARMPALIASGRAGHASMMARRSGSGLPVFVSIAPAFAPAQAEIVVFPEDFAVCSVKVAQLVEHRTENPSVGGSTPPLTTAGRLSPCVSIDVTRRQAASLFLDRSFHFRRRPVRLVPRIKSEMTNSPCKRCVSWSRHSRTSLPLAREKGYSFHFFRPDSPSPIIAIRCRPVA